MEHLGKLAFSVGLVLAILCAFFDIPWLPWVIGLLGVVVGYLNVGQGEIRKFLLAASGLTIALLAIGIQPYNPEWLDSIVLYVRVFVSHALLLVAFLSVYRLAKD